MSLLLQHNATLKGSSALALAAQRGKLDMVKFLLKKGAFIDENCDSHWFDTLAVKAIIAEKLGAYHDMYLV